MARREPGAFRERLHREVGVRVLGDPVLDLAEGFTDGGLGGELGAELRLVAGAPQEHDEMAGDGERHVPSVFLLDQGEREVDAGGDAGRCRQPSVAYEDRVRVHAHRRVRPGKRLAHGPVGGHPVAVELARLGEEEGAGAHRHELPGPGAVGADPVDQLRGGSPRARASRHEEQIGRRGVSEPAVGDEREAAGAADRCSVQRGGAQVVGDAGEAGGAGEDLHRAAHVEALHALEEDDEYGSLLHALHPGRSDRWRQ